MTEDGQTAKGPTYNYEALLDEHFQNLVQALLVKAFPDLKCYPVGMPDGGRDATSSLNEDSPNSLVFQVKFSRNPAAIADVYKWITDALSKEEPKIRRLRSLGAKKYVLVTNAYSSSHLETGTIDRVNAFASTHLDIDFECFWREDLDRRLDGEFDIKLRYPLLLNGPDLLRMAWESPRKSDSMKRSRRAFESYLRDQYKTDETLRFKQVDMITTKLFDLFIDVPTRLLEEPVKTARRQETVQLFARAARRRNSREYDTWMFMGGTRREGPTVGAAGLFSDPLQMQHVNRVVIEGAPGQGKSTLSQYLAQIQRARYLQKTASLDSLPDFHVAGPAYLPFKLELRDLALWINGFDPWDKRAGSLHNQTTTLESAMAAHVRRYSGGAEFSVSDLQELIEAVPTMLILDALDEVADLDDRANVIREVETALSRLEGKPGSFVTIVTSRPTALSNAPMFSQEEFTYYSLASLNGDLAIEYAQKWAAARAIPDRDYQEVHGILTDKLQSPHMAELAKNTMQLTILLSLILTRGSSLPDKRTELYSAYLEQFLSRESDKNIAVRTNRNLILDIHGYLGYYLHARAEGQKDSGRISQDELRKLLSEYLEREQQNIALVDTLFIAVVERVVALVSRVEGTFEFEVQPLREYFAGRYLYETASYSPPGRERRGTKPDRFDGIAPNPYWQNATRFFAGFFSKGELMDLAVRVCDLITDGEARDDAHGFHAYPRRLAISLLQDWVFAQSPKAVRMVVETVFSGRGFQWLTALMNKSATDLGMISGTRSSFFELSPGGGGAEVAREILYARLDEEYDTDFTPAICALLRSCTTQAERLTFWRDRYERCQDSEVSLAWVRIGAFLDCNRMLGITERLDVINPSQLEGLGDRLDSFMVSARDLENLEEELWLNCVRALLDWGGSRDLRTPNECQTDDILLISHPRLWYLVLHHRIHPTSIIDQHSKDTNFDNPGIAKYLDRISPEVKRLYESVQLVDYRRTLRPWELVIEFIEVSFGRSWSSIGIAVASAGIRSQQERGKGVRNLVDDPMSLPQRMRYARRQAKRHQWWEQQAQRISGRSDAQLFLAAAVVWASPAVLMKLHNIIDPILGDFDEDDLSHLGWLSHEAAMYSNVPHQEPISPTNLPAPIKRLSPRYLRYIYARLSLPLRVDVALLLLEAYRGNVNVARICFGPLADTLTNKNRRVPAVLHGLSACAKVALTARHAREVPLSGPESLRHVPVDEILAYDDTLPVSVSGLAFSIAETRESKPIPVEGIASSQGWFDDQVD